MSADYGYDVINAAREAARQMDFFGTSKKRAARDQAAHYHVAVSDVLNEMDWLADEYMMFDNMA